MVQSGKLFSLTDKDMDLMVSDMQNILSDWIVPGEKIGFFLPLTGSFLLPLLLYRTCVERGATVLRYGCSNLERQFELLDITEIDKIISTPTLWKHIKDILGETKEVPWLCCHMGTDVDCFSVESLKDNTARIVIEHSEIPMYLIQNKDGLFSCPGYEMQINGENSEGELYVGTGLFEGFSVWNFPTGIIVARAAPACPGVEVKHSFSIVDINKSDTGFPPIRTRIMKILKKYNKGSSMEGSFLEFDSLGIVELLVLLEEEFSFRVKVDEINRSEFLSVDSIVDFVTRKVEVTSGREGDIQ